MIYRRATQLAIVPVLLLLCGGAWAGPWKEHESHGFEIVPGPGVTDQGMISDYHAALTGTIADSPYYILEGEQPGGTLFVLGGSHPSEPAGVIAAILLIETAVIEQGRLVVVPYANPLGVRPDQEVKEFQTPDGARRLVYGVRRSLPKLHEADPEQRYSSPAGVRRDPHEGRNLNRVWPGRKEGTGTEQIAHAITELIGASETDIALDLHETVHPWGDIAWTLAGRTRDEDFVRAICTEVNASIELDLIRPRHLDRTRGLSTLEWEPATGARSLLTETVRDSATPIDTRVAIQTETVLAAAEVLQVEKPGSTVRIREVPRYAELLERGLRTFLLTPPGATH